MSVLLLQEGGVFSFGAGGCGQLGHNSTQNEILPKRVMELMGSVISQITCGRLVSSQIRVWKVSVISQTTCGRLVSFHRKCVEG